MTVARWKRTASGYACQDTATGIPAGDRRYIRSDPPRLLLKLVRFVRLDINCRQLAWMRLLVHERSAKRYVQNTPVFYIASKRYLRLFLFFFEFRGFNQMRSREDHLSTRCIIYFRLQIYRKVHTTDVSKNMITYPSFGTLIKIPLERLFEKMN